MDTVIRASRSASPYVGFDAFTIIAALLPILAACFKREQPEQDPRDYLREQYDPVADRFPRALVARTLPQVRRAARQEGKRLNHRQAVQVAESSLKEAMRADDAEINHYMNGLTSQPAPVEEEVDLTDE